MAGYKWHPIEDLPDNWEELIPPEVQSFVFDVARAGRRA
jgi:hypothetical protein